MADDRRDGRESNPWGRTAAVTRRRLLRTAFWAGAAGASAGTLLGLLHFLRPARANPATLVRLSPSALPRSGDPPLYLCDHRLYLVNLAPGEGLPPANYSYGWSLPPGAEPSRHGGILALRPVCTHLGCTLPWRPNFEFQGVRGWFRCPCHAATFTKAGINVFGPATRPLDTFEIRAQPDGSILIDTERIERGNAGNPQRAVPA